MQSILNELSALMGVKGSFVCGRDGCLLVRAMPNGTDDTRLSAIGHSLMQTLAGLEVDRKKRANEMEFAYGGSMLLIKNLGAACLCVLCARQANVAMVNMTANMAARRLKEAIATSAATAPVAAAPAATPVAAPPAETPAAAPAAAPPAAAPAAAPAGAPAGPSLPLSAVSQVEHELARAVGPVAMLVVDDSLVAMGFTRETLPAAEGLAWLERLGAEIANVYKRGEFMQAARQILHPA
jgi:predicted regulator of Ras-like GTPase activity (Roadblock/LC7/MglB family)